MKKRNQMGTKIVLLVCLLFSVIIGQSNGYLAQKLMIENSLRNRISDAMEKVIDNRKYVIDVSVDLEVSSAIESETTFSPNDGTVKSLQSARDMVNAGDAPASGSVGPMGGLVIGLIAGVVCYYMVCLLYTSPSPRDRTRSRMPSSA